MPQRELDTPVSRRKFLALSGAGTAALASASMMNGGLIKGALAADAVTKPRRAPARYPIGIELYAVRGELARDLPNTLRTVSKMGYEVVEFYAPYLGWTFPYAKDVRRQLDDLGLRCFSTHNSMSAITPGDTMARAIELNQILGSRSIIVASPPANTSGPEDWQRVSAQFAAAAEQLKPHGLAAGFHNHLVEWTPLSNGKRAMDIIAANTPPEFTLQFDVGTCLEAHVDPVAWISANRGRIRSVHLKDWAPGKDADEKGFRVLFGEGVGPWKEIIAAVESVGGVEYYLMEQEGSRYSEFDTAQRCLESWRALRRTI